MTLEHLTLVLPEKVDVERDDLILSVPSWALGRVIRRQRLGDATSDMLPAFIKPVVPKQFAAAVYTNLGQLALATAGMSPDDGLLVSERVEFLAEARAFVLDGRVQACATYEGAASAADAAAFAQRVVDAVPVPRTVVVDVGLLASGAWALIEFNATWGAGLNGCSAQLVIPCIEAATKLGRG